MDYCNFNIEDFLTDVSFVNYCFNLNDEDTKHWENVILTQPLLKTNITEARQLCLMLGVRVSRADKLQALHNLKTAIEAEPLITSTPVRKLWLPRIAVAATLLIAAIAFGLYKYNSTVPGAVLYSHVSDNTYHVVAKTDKSRKNVILPDGTTVTLNGLSTLKIANDYNQDNRHVVLSGEAFFEVKKDRSRPFVVLTGRTATTALGTSFKVSAYHSLKVASVMLATGKVKVEATQASSNVKPQLLTPGQQVVLTNGSNSFAVSNYNQESLKNWLESKLTFSDANFAEIKSKLLDTYGIEIVTDKKIAEKIRFTGQFSNKSIAEVLEAIGFVNNFTYRQNGNTVQIVN